MPNVQQPASAYKIVANTETTLTVANNAVVGPNGMLDAQALGSGQPYYIAIKTPAVDSTDYVYLDVYFDEIDAVEDPNLDHGLAFGALQSVEAARRMRAVYSVFVNQGIGVAGNQVGHDVTDSTYLDSDGNRHHLMLLSAITRKAGGYRHSETRLCHSTGTRLSALLVVNWSG